MNEFLLSLFLCSCFSFFFSILIFFSKKKTIISLFFEIVSLFSSVFSSLLWNFSERTTVGDRNFIFLTLLPPPCFSFERRVERREKEREKESFCSRCGRVVGMSFTVTTTTALNTRGLRMQNSSTLVGKRIGQKRGTFVNENRNTKARNGSRETQILKKF